MNQNISDNKDITKAHYSTLTTHGHFNKNVQRKLYSESKGNDTNNTDNMEKIGTNEEHTSNYFDGVDDINLSQLHLHFPAIIIVRKHPKGVNSDHKVHFPDEAKKLFGQHILKNTKRASSTQ